MRSEVPESVIFGSSDVREENVAASIKMAVSVIAVPDVQNPKSAIALFCDEQAVTLFEWYVVIIVLPPKLSVYPIRVRPWLLVFYLHCLLLVSVWMSVGLEDEKHWPRYAVGFAPTP